MNINTLILLGRSGCGKDTQADLLKEKYGYMILSTGELFRSLAQEQTFAGKKVAVTLEKGELPPGWLAEFLWTRWLTGQQSLPERFIFNGAPRRLDEAEELDEALEWFGRQDGKALLVDISSQEAKQRLLKRARDDDDERAIDERLMWFEESVVPVIAHYETLGRLVRINGEQPIEKVFEDIVKNLEQ